MQSINSKNLLGFQQEAGSSLPATFAWLSLLLLLVLLVAAPAYAQFGSSLSGTVLDPTGAAIPGATVILTNEATQKALTSITNDTGAYHFGELGPGHYSIVTTAAGFKKNNLTDVALEAE